MSGYIDENARIADDIHNAYEEGYANGKRDAVVDGHWIDSGIDGFDRCSNCKAIWDVSLTKRNMFFRHCPRCGAKMDKKLIYKEN